MTLRQINLARLHVRLARLKASRECIPYFENVPLGQKARLHLSIYGAWPSRRIFVEVSNVEKVQVRLLFSRLRNLPPLERQTEMPLVDMADAFVVAKRMADRWPPKPTADRDSSPVP